MHQQRSAFSRFAHTSFMVSVGKAEYLSTAAMRA